MLGLLGGGGEGSWREGGELRRTWGEAKMIVLAVRGFYILVGDILWHLMSLGEHNMCKNGLQGYYKFNSVGKWFKQMARISERGSFLPEHNCLNKRSVLCK